ncbi:MAG: hypothetical protein DBW85_00890 [Synechococcus sp. MED-G71]|nr:MAG: hypothetical protein DBW85_00890 [Synechococcus sp. MED-G71]
MRSIESDITVLPQREELLALTQDLLPAWRKKQFFFHEMNCSENFVGLSNKLQAFLSATCSLYLKQQICIGNLQLFQCHA